MGKMEAGAVAPAPTGHSPFGASGAHRWTVCHGSIAAQRGLPEEKSIFAQEGTALHAVSALCLTNKQDAIEYVDRVVEEVEIDEEHAEAIQVYVDKCRSVKPLPGTLTVIDAKFGRGKIVEVFRPDLVKGIQRPNIQLAYYALGALHAVSGTANRGKMLVEVMFHLKHLHPLFFGTADCVIVGPGKIERVELIVVQPRAYHKHGPIRAGSFSVEEIEAVGVELLAAAAKCTDDAPRVAGDHCTFCKAAGKCKTLRDLSFAQAQLDFDDDVGMTAMHGEKTRNPLDMDDAELVLTLDALDTLEAFIRACRAHAHIVAGGPKGLDGWKLVDRQARRKWSDETKVVAELCFGFGLDEGSIYAKKLMSPAQVEKLLPPAERKSDAFKALCPALSSGSTLVRADNPRPERKPVQADFDDGLSTGDDTEW